MVYNKFKEGFLRNLPTYLIMFLFSGTMLTCMIGRMMTEDHWLPIVIVGTVFWFVCFVGMIYNLLFSDVVIFDEQALYTNRHPYRNNEKYRPKRFKKVKIPYDQITKVEKRILSHRQCLLIIHLKDDEPVTYYFEHKNTRDSICDSLLQYAKINCEP